jgi:hypothetical protein
VACLVAVLSLRSDAVLGGGSRDETTPRGGGENALMSAALQEAVARLKAEVGQVSFSAAPARAPIAGSATQNCTSPE